MMSRQVSGRRKTARGIKKRKEKKTGNRIGENVQMCQ